ncbi:hypothetical protein CPC08DRAFT_714068 [Agrocybe pediades]|nr:hypothetical protein CPC08DRAFT_714068 [Agrocybe pediades]
MAAKAQSIVHVFPGVEQGVGEQSAQSPSLILLLGWMDAPLSLLMKYVEGHHSLYPTSTVVVVESYTSFMWSSTAHKEAKLLPVINILLEQIYKADRPTVGLLVHAISNAGAIHLMTLAGFLRDRLRKDPSVLGESIPAIRMAFIIDSTPGTNDYESIITTFTLTMGPVAKLAARLPLTLGYLAYYMVYNTLLGNSPLLPRLHSYLGQEQLLPGSNGKEPRLYIYSDTDAMVPFASVERHLSVLSAKNIPFTAEKYLGTQHVSHARKDPKRYWGAVAEVWRKALDQSKPTIKAKL